MSNPEYAFIHIPKNAGMSFERALKDSDKIKYFGHSVLFKNIENTKNIYVIRNPIERFTSAFYYLKRYPKHPNSHLFQTPDQLVQALLNLELEDAFKFMMPNKGHVINGKPISTDWVFAKQTAWLHKPFKYLVYEILEEELVKLNQELGTDIKLPHINKSSKIDFEYSKTSMDYLKVVYSEDIKLWDYLVICRHVENIGCNRQKSL